MCPWQSCSRFLPVSAACSGLWVSVTRLETISMVTDNKQSAQQQYRTKHLSYNENLTMCHVYVQSFLIEDRILPLSLEMQIFITLKSKTKYNMEYICTGIQ